MPEGLCPLSVQTMSEHMDKIIRNYTLRGRHVLAHCRGGVGRAGLVACTWMLKLGICGSVPSKQQQDPASNVQETTGSREQVIQDPTIQAPPESLMRERKVPRDSMELLERVVYIIRRQRSVKAIETYEQVRFLLEFIEYLRDLDMKSESVPTS
jgi:protein tyrosine phosphatase